MNKLILVLAILSSQFTIGQEIYISKEKKEYIPADILMENGDTITGFIKDFTKSKTIEIRGPGYDFKSLEKQLNLNNTNFNFKRQEDGPEEKLESKDIKKIIFDEETTIFEKLKLKTVNSKLEIIDIKYEVMIPLLEEGKINIYGTKVYECSTKPDVCNLSWILIYVKKPTDEFAYIPIDINKITLFNFWKTDDKLFRIWEEIGKDCPDFLEYLANYKIKYDTKEFKKELANEYKIYLKETADKLKNIADYDERKAMDEQLFTEHYMKSYYTFINEYSSRCN
jgi:hypothetical protein